MAEYRIGSFNMRNFGFGSHKDFDKIADIIEGEDFDVVALQEIRSEGKGVEKLVNYNLPGWDSCFAEPRESNDYEKSKDKRGEGYSYIWNKSSFSLLETTIYGETRVFEPRIINSMSDDVSVDCSIFARAHYYIRLEPEYGGFFELRLIDIHIYCGEGNLDSIVKRKIEYNILVNDIYPEICERTYGNHRPAYTIAMGDYNLNIITPFVQPQARNAYLDNYVVKQVGQEEVSIITLQEDLTTLRDPRKYGGYANNFDHFTYSPEMAPFECISCRAVDVTKYCDLGYYWDNISDHLPIAMTIEI